MRRILKVQSIVMLFACLQPPGSEVSGAIHGNEFIRQTVSTWKWRPKSSSRVPSTILECASLSAVKGFNAFIYDNTTSNCTMGYHSNKLGCDCTANTLITVYSTERDVPGQCPYEAPYAINNGFSCCPNFLRVNNTSLSINCNGKALQFTDPVQCCSGVATVCPYSNSLGCTTHMDRRFNATTILLLGNGSTDTTLDLASSTYNSNIANQWPVRGAAPFGGSFGNCILVCVGYSGTASTSNACSRSVYSETGTWTTGPSTLSGHNNPMSTMVQDSKLWVVGGSSSKTELFDFTTQSWSFGPDLVSGMTNYSYGIAVVALSSTRVMLFGGCGSLSTDQSYIYDFATGSWTAKANLNRARCIHGSGMVWLNDGTQVVLATGGFYKQSGVYLNTVELYNVATNTWTYLTQALGGSDNIIANMIGCVANNRLFIPGGKLDGHLCNPPYSNSMWEFNSSTISAPSRGFILAPTMPFVDYSVFCVPFHLN